MAELLSEQEIETLSGCKRANAQINWLAKHGINHFVRKDGRPSVTWHFVNNPLGMKPKGPLPEQPDFEAM